MNNFIGELPTVEPLVGDVYATRHFNLERTHDGTYHIVGLGYKQPIVEGINVSVCGVGRKHAVPDPDCSCGFYAFDDPKKAWGGPKFLYAGQLDAVVRFSGRVVVAKGGLRAERMEIVALSSPHALTRERVAKISNYELFDSREEMLRTFPVVPIERELDSPLGEIGKTVGRLKRRTSEWAREIDLGSVVKKIVMFAIAVFVTCVLIHTEAEVLPEGYKIHSILAVGMLYLIAWVILKTPSLISLPFYIGLMASSVSLAMKFEEQLEKSGFDNFVVSNILFMGVYFSILFILKPRLKQQSAMNRAARSSFNAVESEYLPTKTFDSDGENKSDK